MSPMIENIIIGLVLLAVSGAITYFSMDYFRKGVESVNWPKHEGVITKSKKLEESDEDSTQFYADIDFEYNINEMKYYGQSKRYIGSGKKESKQNFEKYQPEDSIFFHVNPENPKDYVDYPGLQTSHYIRIVVIAILGLMGLSFLLR